MNCQVRTTSPSPTYTSALWLDHSVGFQVLSECQPRSGSDTRVVLVRRVSFPRESAFKIEQRLVASAIDGAVVHCDQAKVVGRDDGHDGERCGIVALVRVVAKGEVAHERDFSGALGECVGTVDPPVGYDFGVGREVQLGDSGDKLGVRQEGFLRRDHLFHVWRDVVGIVDVRERDDGRRVGAKGHDDL